MGQRDYWLYPLDMVTLSIEEEEEAEEEGRGRREWLSERPFGRESNGRFERGFFQGNGRGNEEDSILR